MASIIKVETLQDTAGNNAVDMQYVSNGSAKVNVNHDGSMSIRNSLNTSSITNLAGSGENYYNFTNSFNAVDFVVHGTNSDDTLANRGMNVQNTWTSGETTVSRVRMNTYAGADPTYVGITCFGDLA